MNLFSRPSVPTIVTQVPKKSDQDVAKAAALARQQLRRRQGRESTILTSGMGATDVAETYKKTLLGA